VVGWATAFVFHHSRPGWRALKELLGVLFGAAVQAVFGGIPGTYIYGAGVALGAALYGATLPVGPLRRVHEVTEG
jgi:hypothetical protein